MRRLAILCALLICPAPAPAQAPPAKVSDAAPTTPPTADRLAAAMRAAGKPTLDLTGRLLPGTPAANYNAATLQAAIDAFKAAGLPAGAPECLMPAGTWEVDRWLFFDSSGVAYRGVGGLCSIVASGRGGGFSVGLFGIVRRPRAATGPRDFTPDHYFDLYGKLDPKGAPKPGARRGLRLGDDSTLAAWSSPWNAGPPGGWETTDALLVEFMVDTSARPLGLAHIAGMLRDDDSAPWCCYGAAGDRVAFRFRLADEAGDRQLVVPAATAPGPHHYAFQIDLARGLALAWVDRVQSAARLALPPGARLVENEDVPFRVGALSERASKYTPDVVNANPLTRDLGLGAIRISRAVRYADAGAGAAQARADGKPLDDGRYYELDGDVLALLAGQDDPASAAAARWVTGWSGVGRASNSWCVPLLAVDPLHASNWCVTGNVTLDRVGLSGRGYYGDGATMGSSLDHTFTRGRFAGFKGIGNPNWLANYYLRVTDSTLDSSDQGLYTYMGMVRMERVIFDKAGRRGLIGGTYADIGLVDSMARHVSCGANGPPMEMAFRFRDCAATLKDIRIDNEEEAITPTRAGIVADAGLEMADGPKITIDDVVMKLPASSPLVELLPPTPGAKAAKLWITNPGVGSAKCLVKTSGGWDVEIDASPYAVGSPAVMDLSAPGPPKPGQAGALLRVNGAPARAMAPAPTTP